MEADRVTAYLEKPVIQQYKSDVGFRTLVDSVNDNMYVIPKYQRKYRWNMEKILRTIFANGRVFPIISVYGGKIQRLRENIPVSLQIAAMLVQQLPTQNAQMVRMQEKILPELLDAIGLAPGIAPRTKTWYNKNEESRSQRRAAEWRKEIGEARACTRSIFATT